MTDLELFNNYLDTIDDFKLIFEDFKKTFVGVTPQEILESDQFTGFDKTRAKLVVVLEKLIFALESNDLDNFVILEKQQLELMELLETLQ